jgi:ABC-type polysaccharide/polyol phosphate transport system ATPase subunit
MMKLKLRTLFKLVVLYAIKNIFQSYILNDNREYTVIGAIGLQGTGKSTFLSMLAGNQTLDKYRQYIFRPCSRDTIYSGLYQTNGLHVYVTESRTIYIDCKPFNCSAIFEEQIRKIRSDTANLSIYKNTQIEVIYRLLFLVK